MEAFDNGPAAPQVTFLVDGTTQALILELPYSFLWDTRNFPDGAHVLRVLARDGSGNESRLDRAVLLSYAPPPAPAIASPGAGFITFVATINVSGFAENVTTVPPPVNGLHLATAAVVGGFLAIVARDFALRG